MTEFYQPLSGNTYTEENLRSKTGLSPDSDPGYLAANGVYTINPTPNPIDTNLYVAEPVYTIVGFYADQSWVATPLPLPTAKANGTVEVQTTANAEVANIVTASGYSAEVLSAAGAMLEVDRPAVYQTVIAEQQVVTDNLAVQVEAIAAATTVDEINNIVNPPTGILSTGRGGAGPLDLNVSEYTEFNSTTLTEADTELYIPGTSTVINYGEFVPNKFDSAGNCFLLGNYLVQIREVATSLVLAEFECPLNAENVDISF